MRKASSSERQPGRHHFEEARRLLDMSLKSIDDLNSIAAAVDMTCRALIDLLEPFIGRHATQALLVRAIYLSKARFKCLNGISTAESATGEVASALTLCLRGESPAAARSAATYVFGNFVWLVTRFIGEDLGMRLLRESRPHSDEERK